MFTNMKEKLLLQIRNMDKNLLLFKDDLEYNMKYIRNSILHARVNEIIDYVTESIRNQYEQKAKNKIN